MPNPDPIRLTSIGQQLEITDAYIDFPFYLNIIYPHSKSKGTYSKTCLTDSNLAKQLPFIDLPLLLNINDKDPKDENKTPIIINDHIGSISLI